MTNIPAFTLTPRRQMGFRTSTRIKKVIITVVLIILSLAALFPFYWMVSGSLKTEFETFQFPPTLYPHEPTLDNYAGITHDLPFGLFYLNTLKIAGLSVLGQLITSSLAGYAFSRLEFPGRDKLFLIVLGTMMVPAIITIIPLYILVYPLNWVNTHNPLIIPAMLGSAFGTFLLRQYMLSLPKELEDAARIDGCNSWQIYYYIALPLMKPALATLALFTFMGQWNDFFAPLIFLDKIDLYTVQLGANLAQGQWHTDQPRLMAGSVMITIPVLIVFLFLQRYFVRGINLTGIQG
ncbi:MAG: carbohydrate ABC transporter permease [Chloroflexota bacterium]